MKLLIGESSGAIGEDVDCGELCKADFSDLRFTAADGTTLLDYWIESVSGATPNQLATVWIEFDSIGTASTTFYMYYGNAAAATVSSGPNTFPFFDDFNDNLIDGAKWTTGGSVAEQNQRAEVTVDSNAAAWNSFNPIATFTPPFRMRCRAQTDANSGGGWALHVGENGTGVVSGHGFGHNSGTWQCPGANGGAGSWPSPPALPVNTYVLLQERLADTTHSIVDINDVAQGSKTFTAAISAVKYGLGGSNGKAKFDWFFISNYRGTEPAWGAWGSEELGIQHYTLALEAATFGITGSPVSLKFGGLVKLDLAVFALVGSPLGLPHGYPSFVLEPGAFAMSGSALAPRLGSGRMNLEPGSFVVTGTPLDPFYSWYRGASSLNYQFAKQRRNF